MYLLDTMVVSERSKSQSHRQVLVWIENCQWENVYVSVVTIGEIERGIRKLERREGQQAARYRSWLETTLSDFAGRVLPISLDIARRWGQLSHDLRSVNPDLLIAATALEHDLTFVTRNVRHFEPTGVKLLNPYEL